MRFTYDDLPQWLKEVTSPPVEDLVMTYNDEEDSFSLNHSGLVTFDTIESAYDYAQRNNLHFIFDDSVVAWCKQSETRQHEHDDEEEDEKSAPQSYLEKLSNDFYETYGYGQSGKMISYKNPSGNYTAMIENSSKGAISDLVERIKYFQRVTAKAYHEYPDNFMYAYGFINDHPMFWLKQNLANGGCIWIDDNGVQELSVYFYNKDEHDDFSETVCVIETGEHVAPEYDMHYFSPALTVKAPSYEQAIIACAARLSQFYDDDGEAKEGYREIAEAASREYLEGTL